MSLLLSILEPGAGAADAAEVVEAIAPMGWPAALVTSVVILVMGALFWKILDEDPVSFLLSILEPGAGAADVVAPMGWPAAAVTAAVGQQERFLVENLGLPATAQKIYNAEEWRERYDLMRVDSEHMMEQAVHLFTAFTAEMGQEMGRQMGRQMARAKALEPA